MISKGAIEPLFFYLGVIMEFIDLKAQQVRIRECIQRAINSVLDHGRYIMGPEVGLLEERLLSFVGARFALTCSSGTDALLMALMALGVGKGDGVITTPFTFIATAEVIALLGATPVFADVDPDTFNIDPGLLEEAVMDSVKKGIRPKAIIPVDIFGLPADYDRINEVAARHSLVVIEDAAQSFGGMYKGRMACNLGHIGCTSFFPAKPLGCYGDGGAIFTNDPEIFHLLKSIRIHGQGSDKYENVRVGINGRLDTLQAAILLCKMDIFEDELEKRQLVAKNYTNLIKEFCPWLGVQDVPEGYRSAWAQYTVKAPTRKMKDDILGALSQEGIPTAVYYPIPLHLQKAFKDLGYIPGSFPVSESLCKFVFSLPMHPYLDLATQERIVKTIAKIRP